MICLTDNLVFCSCKVWELQCLKNSFCLEDHTSRQKIKVATNFLKPGFSTEKMGSMSFAKKYGLFRCQRQDFRSYFVQRLSDSVIISWLLELSDSWDSLLPDGWAFFSLIACSYSLWCFERKCDNRFEVFPHRAEITGTACAMDVV